MKRLALLIFTTSLTGPVAADDTDARVDAARAASRQLMQSLKAELQGAMQAGGPLQALSVCNEKAPVITAQVAEELGLAVTRTSHRVRNPGNAPDAWERKVLDSFLARKAAAEDLKTMEHHAVVDAGGKRTFRYMKAIPLGGICVTCHGGAIDPALSRRIYELYPQDQARGFQPGDLRGAFSVSQDL